MSGRRLERGEVRRIVKAARELIAAHERRNQSSKHATLGEEQAMWELNFQLGVFRASWHESPASTTAASAASQKELSDG